MRHQRKEHSKSLSNKYDYMMFKKNLPKSHLPLNRSFVLQTSQHRNDVLLAGEGWGGGDWVCPLSKFQNQSFPLLSMRSCPDRYCTIVHVVFAIVLIAVTVSSHLHVICHCFICFKSLFQGHVACWNFTLKGPQ